MDESHVSVNQEELLLQSKLSKTEKKEININESKQINADNLLKTDSIKSDDNNILFDNVHATAPKSTIKKKPLSRKQMLIRSEKLRKGKNKYEALGIGFDLRHVTVNDADSGEMKALKNAVREYLLTKQTILNKANLNDKSEAGEEKESSKSQIRYIHSENIGRVAVGYEDSARAYQSYAKRHSGLSSDAEEALRGPYNKAIDALHKYTAFKCIWFKWGRGRARLKQVKAIKDMLQAENRKYSLSELRHDLDTSRDYAMHNTSYGIIPTYLGAVRNKDMIDRRHARLRREGRNNSLHIGWYGALIKDIGNWALAAYHVAGGTAFRAAAVPVMIASNALEVVGKAAKLALKGVSLITNSLMKLFHKKKRWNIKVNKHTMTHGWTSLNSARKFNFIALKNIIGIPLITVWSTGHSICRFIRIKVTGDDRNEVGDIWKSNFSGVVFNAKQIYLTHKINIRNFFGASKAIEDRAQKEYEDTMNSLELDDEDELEQEEAKDNIIDRDDVEQYYKQPQE